MTESWQVQELDGTSVEDHATQDAANIARARIAKDLQTALRVRRTS